MARTERYTRSVEKSLEVLVESEIAEFPVDLGLVIARYSGMIQVRTYSEYMERGNLTLEECKSCLSSAQGTTMRNGQYNQFIIFYNDHKDKNINRFTIAHELGHILLGHFDEQSASILSKTEIKPDLYTVFENEANCFARNLLSPAYHAWKVLDNHGYKFQLNPEAGAKTWMKVGETSLTTNLKTHFDAEDLLEKAFNISPPAARVRLGTLSWDQNQYTYHGVDWRIGKDIQHSVQWNCISCHTVRSPQANYCTECGRKGRFTFSSETTKRYSNIHISAKGRFQECPVCGNTDISSEANYCKHCGAPLLNPCESSKRHPNQPEAKFCAICGKPTLYEKEKWLEKMEYNHNGDKNKMTEKETTVQFNPDTFRVKECPRCHNKDFSDDAVFCKKCGLILINLCDPVQIDSDINGRPMYADQHANPPDARFCEHCGRETLYYVGGVLKSYDGKERPKQKKWDDYEIPF